MINSTSPLTKGVRLLWQSRQKNCIANSGTDIPVCARNRLPALSAQTGMSVPPFLVWSCAIFLSFSALPLYAADAAAASKLFALTVKPLLERKCFACHGADANEIEGSLDMRSRDGLLKGGESGEKILIPGDAAKSWLYIAATWENDACQMPPKEKDRLTDEELWQLRDWINAGAPWSNDAEIATIIHAATKGGDGVIMTTSGGLSESWNLRRYQPADLWAYQPIGKPSVPAIAAIQANPIDAFLQARLQEREIKPAPRADRRTLLRRASFDLRGLPPTDQESVMFRFDQGGDAFEKLIDNLLASPQYGEQQARHWLDVVRYADTSGFSNDFERPNAWRYRDYVIRSFNADKPFDRFVVEQLAGDELEPKNPEMQIAVGFLRMGPWEHTGMTVAAVTRQQFLDDITNQVGVTFLGQALRCAQCHDHKFDPVPTRDYYRIQAVFATTQFAERPLPFQPNENISDFTASKARLQERLNDARAASDRIKAKNQAAIAAVIKEAGVDDIAKIPAMESRRDNIGLSKDDLSTRKMLEKRIGYFERELLRFEPYAFSVYTGAPNNYASFRPINHLPKKHMTEPPACFILTGGALESPGAEVAPGVLSAVVGSNDVVNATAWNKIPSGVQGRRLALARWIASGDNTLTARVIVNRVWQQHFGRGLVATPNNFGKAGGKPTHPELLDWLATWFIDNGWSIKKLHRLIMTSSAYQRTGEHSEMNRLREIDGKNELLAYFPSRRLAAEEIRDSLLVITGELNAEHGGPGIYPEINWEVAFQPRHIMGSVAPAYQPSPTPLERNRRTIYAFRYRTLSDPMLEVFNRPGSEISCERRDDTTVTPQALALFNSEFVRARSIALADRIAKKNHDPTARIAAAFQSVYGRAPSTSESDRCCDFLTTAQLLHEKNPPVDTKLPTKVKRHVVEEMTGDAFEWDEELDVLANNYQRDLNAWQIDAPTRALADLCLALMNSNEFLYVR